MVIKIFPTNFRSNSYPLGTKLYFRKYASRPARGLHA